MEQGTMDVRVLRNLFLEALEDEECRTKAGREDNVVIKGYLIDPEKTVEPSVVNVLNELNRRARRTAA